MQIDSRSWHAKVYQRWYKRNHGYNAETTNLCRYCRAVLFWSWLQPIFVDGHIGNVPIAALSWGSIGLLLEYIAVKHIGMPLLIAEGITLLCLGAIVGLFFGISALNSRVEPKMQSFVSVLKERAHAAHKGICPFVNFEN